MSSPHRSTLTLALLSGSLAVVSACSNRPVASRPEGARAVVQTQVRASQAQAAAVPAPAAPDAYSLGLSRASSAFNISQSAQSKDDWYLVAERWQQAIEFMAAVPKSSQHHDEAALKLTDYRRNLAFAQQQADRPAANGGSGVVVRNSQGTSSAPSGGSLAASSAPITALPPAQGTSRSSDGGSTSDSGTAFFAPIVRRAGNTPVIAVTFNGSQTYEMIVDTGASGTLITPQMASSLGVRSVGETSVDTASAQGVSFSLGYVDSIEVGGAVAQNVLVAMGGPELSLGLLGHDFFGNYDIIIRENEVEFRER
jgi:predicted aspartyl protease